MKYINLFLLLLIVGLSCHKDIEEEKITKVPNPVPEIKKLVKASVLGYVYDEEGNPIADASVVLYDKTQKTDQYGVFEFKDIKMDQLGTLISVSKTGFITNYDKIFPKSNQNYSYIQLYKLDNGIQFKSDKGGTIDIKGGGKIIFSPNSIADADGKIYKGNVIINSFYLDPKDNKIIDKMPGALMGTAKNGNTAILGTMGMALVELRDEAGNKLNLKKGTTANLILPVNNQQLNSAPAEIPLWYFDETDGLWKEEGMAHLQDNKYSGEVSHFSWWNLDYNFVPVYMCAKVVFSNGEPAVAYIVRLTADVIYPTVSGYTDSEGQVCGLVPKKRKMKLEVVNPYCNKILYTKEIGPFDSDVTLDEIVLNANDFLASGIVTCNGEPVSDARVVLKYKNPEGLQTRILNTSADGKYEMNLLYSECEIVNSAEIFAYNPITGDASPKVELNVDQENPNIELNICNNCNFSLDIVPSYNSDCDMTHISLEAVVSDYGYYSYKWSNGKTSKKIKNVIAGDYCVTVTQSGTECKAVKCIKVHENKLTVLYSHYQHPYCDYNNGIITTKITGGIEPYKISVSGPNGYSYDTTGIMLNLVDLSEGKYIIKIEDAGGCIKTVRSTLERDKNHNVYIEIDPAVCDSAILEASINYINKESLSYTWSDGQTGQRITVKSSGYYCVTVSEGTNCEISNCENVDVNHSVLPPQVVTCDKNIYTIQNISPYKVKINGYLLIDPFQSLYINIFDSGYEYFYYFLGAQCGNIEGEDYLPYLENGIVIDSVHSTSCEGCEDGKIFYTFNPNNPKYNCTVGDVYIYAEDDLDTDLRSKNDAGNLADGSYYVVVKDANTGCFISYKYVSINQGENCLSGSLQNGIVAFYPFTNGKYDDVSGNNLHLTKVGFGNVYPATDRKNNNCAVEFVIEATETAILEYKNPEFMDTLDNFSISLWYQNLNIDSIGNDSNKMLFFRGSDYYGLNIFLDEYCNQAYFIWTDEIKDDDNYYDCETAKRDHNWHHLVATYDKQTNKMQLFRNGVLQSSSIENNFDLFNDGSLIIGNGFIGKMDDIILYNRVLTNAEIQQLYNTNPCCN